MVITKSPVETECASDFLCDFLLFYLRHSSDLQLLYQVIHISCIYMALYDSLAWIWYVIDEGYTYLYK